MKNIIKYSCCTVLLLQVFLSSCKKDAYLTDDGVHEAATSLSTYDYLAANKYHIFDTLIMIIDHLNLKQEVNSAKTFFAPTNYSITRKINRYSLVYPSLDSVYKYMTADSLRQYILQTTVTLDAALETPVAYVTAGKTNAAVQKIKQTDPAYSQWSTYPVYTLYFIKVRGTMDDPDNPPPPNDPDVDTRVSCQTTGIQTSSGTTLHVLSNLHIFSTF
jgi:hypothetical protein